MRSRLFRRSRGPLGILTALTQPSPDALREAIRETRRITKKPFGVNITLLPSINPPDYAGYAKAAVDEGVRIFETAGNNRTLQFYFVLVLALIFRYSLAKPLIQYFKAQGCTVIHKCTTIRHAKVSLASFQFL
jgi:NADH:quinone reductase (non-electrogenic)